MRINLLEWRGASFEFRNLRNRIERRVSQLILRQLHAPMIRYEDRVGANRADDQHRKDSFAAARDDAHALAIINLQFHRSFRMNFDVRFGALLNQKTNAPSLIAGKILIDDAPAGENPGV